MPATFGIVDLFAGPGGLGEGFASLDVGGHAPFRIGISVEKEASAHRTLTLRAFLRAHEWFYRNREGANAIAMREAGIEERYAEASRMIAESKSKSV